MRKVDSFYAFIEFLTELEKDRRTSVELEKNNPSSPYGPQAWRMGKYYN